MRRIYSCVPPPGAREPRHPSLASADPPVPIPDPRAAPTGGGAGGVSPVHGRRLRPRADVERIPEARGRRWTRRVRRPDPPIPRPARLSRSPRHRTVPSLLSQELRHRHPPRHIRVQGTFSVPSRVHPVGVVRGGEDHGPDRPRASPPGGLRTPRRRHGVASRRAVAPRAARPRLAPPRGVTERTRV